MAKFFSMTRDINGYNGFGLQFPDYCFSANLKANVASTALTVPGDETYWVAIFQIAPGSNVFVSVNGTAAVAGNSGNFSAVTSVYNPTALKVRNTDTITCITSVSFVFVLFSFFVFSSFGLG